VPVTLKTSRPTSENDAQRTTTTAKQGSETAFSPPTRLTECWAIAGGDPPRAAAMASLGDAT
jgi:hypothetical protein